MEFKLDGTAEEALLQINEKHYAQPFESNDWELFKIGVNFSAKTRNIEKSKYLKLVGKVFLPFSFVYNILRFHKAMLWISKSYALWLLKHCFK